jgi:hemin uptake protein HemP
MSHNDDGQAHTDKLAQPLPIQRSSSPSGLRIVDSSDLLAGQSSLLIRHGGEVYRLQTTRQGKLILTK